MEARLEKIENSEAYLEIEVDAETLEEGLEKAYRKVVKQVTVPGFRKGRVPRELLEAHYGKEVLYEDAIEIVIPDNYEKAIDELDIKAIAQPEFDVVDIEGGKGLKFTAKVAVKPDVKLGKLEGLEVKIPVFEVKEEDVDKRMEEVRARYAKVIEKVEEAAIIGDTVTIDFEGFIDDVAFEGGSGEDYQLELGSNTFIPGFEEQLTGLKVGDSKDVKVTFPESYHAEDLAGKEAIFKVKIKKIEGKELRNLDDEFAQEVSNYETIAEFRDSIRNNLTELSEMQKKGILREEVLIKALEQCEMFVPDAVIEIQAQNMLKQFEDRMRMQGLSMEQYFQLTGSNIESFKQEVWPDAERNAKTNFMLEKILEEKGFEVSDEELDKEIEEVATRMGVDSEQARQNLAGVIDNVSYSIKMDKTIQYLIDNAVVTEYEDTNNETKSEGELDE